MLVLFKLKFLSLFHPFPLGTFLYRWNNYILIRHMVMPFSLYMYRYYNNIYIIIRLINQKYIFFGLLPNFGTVFHLLKKFRLIWSIKESLHATTFFAFAFSSYIYCDISLQYVFYTKITLCRFPNQDVIKHLLISC